MNNLCSKNLIELVSTERPNRTLVLKTLFRRNLEGVVKVDSYIFLFRKWIIYNYKLATIFLIGLGFIGIFWVIPCIVLADLVQYGPWGNPPVSHGLWVWGWLVGTFVCWGWIVVSCREERK